MRPLATHSAYRDKFPSRGTHRRSARALKCCSASANCEILRRGPSGRRRLKAPGWDAIVSMLYAASERLLKVPCAMPFALNFYDIGRR